MLSDVYSSSRQFDLAISEIDRSIELNPSDAAGYAWRGSTLVYTGHSSEAIADFEIAKRLNPGLGSGRGEPVGWAYYLERRYEEAVTAFAAGVRTAPNDFYIHAGLAASHAQLGRKNEAAQAAADVVRTWPFFRIDQFIAEFQGEADRALIAEGLRKAGLK